MGRTRGRDDPRRSRHSRNSTRTARKRAVYVFAEGEVTEETYVDLVTRIGSPADPARRVDHHILSAGFPTKKRKPLPLAHAATTTARQVFREARRSGLTDTDWYWPQVWCLFDRDEHRHIGEAFREAEAAGVNIAYSHPCFELWRLLHYQNYTSTFGGVCDSAAARLRAQSGFAATYGAGRRTVSAGEAKVVLPGQLRDRYETARAHARKMNAQHQGQRDPNAWDPYTDVWEFVENGLLIARY